MNVHALSKKIHGTPILKNIQFDLGKNEIVGLVGRNGSGKTTLFRLLSGHYEWDQGEFLLDKKLVPEHPELKEQLFYIDEKDNFLGAYSLKKNADFYQAAYSKFDHSLFIRLTKQYGFAPDMSYRRLSKGQQRLFQMVLAICSNAKYLLLDEPFDGLDVFIRKEVIALLMHSISDGEHTALIASHNLLELENLIDRVLILKQKTISNDYRLEDMRQHARKIQFVFKTKKVPAVVKQHAKLVHTQGRVITVIFEHFTPELEKQLRAIDPLIFEELPLSLEDLFEADLKQKGGSL